MNEDYKNKTIGELRKLNLSLTELCFDLKLLENNKSIFENTRYVFENFEKSIKEPLKKFRDSIDAFKNRNPIFINEDWYLSEDVWLKFSLPEIYSINPIELEKLLIKEFEKNKTTIKDRILRNHTERTLIINELFESYKRKHYFSVVTLAYSIIDGISKEKFGINFWGYDKGPKMSKSSQISHLVEPDSVFEIITKSLKNRGEISCHIKDVSTDKIPHSNNRHFVMHGESYLYGNKTNALKSIFMLDFISSLTPSSNKISNHE
jgi:hypothetical protein